MNKLVYILKILKDRILRPYDDILLRFNTNAKEGDELVWRIFVNGQEHFASGFEISGYINSISSDENGLIKYNIGCKGRVGWYGTYASIFAVKPQADLLL